MNNREKGEAFAQKVHEYLQASGLDLQREYVVDVGLSSRHKKKHAFDLGNSKQLIECKYFDWTVGDNNPSGKIATLNEAMVYFFTASSGFQKRIFVKRTGKKGKRQPETLAEYYIRLHRHFIPDDVELWEFDDETRTAKRLFN
jgi:hypothetical protein